MHIALLLVKNYRSCVSTVMDLAPYTPIVGSNNTGKSNILRAIGWFLEPEKPDQDDYNDRTKEIEVAARIDGITTDNLGQLQDRHRVKMEEFVKAGRIYLRRVFDPTAAKPAVKTEVAAGDAADIASAVWQVNPAGIDQAIGVLFPKPIVVEAMSDAAADVTSNTKTSTIGRLITDIIGDLRKAHETDIAKTLAGIGDMFGHDGANRPRQLTDLDRDATAQLSSIFPGLTLHVHVPTPTMDILFKAATVKVREYGTIRDVDVLGHGAQRSIQIALIRVLAERAGTIGKSTNTLLLIEEPEIYLHPFAIETTRVALKLLAKNGYQVIAVTHSPQFVPEDDIVDTVLLRKEAGGTRSLGTMRAQLDKTRKAHVSQAEVLFSLTSTNQILFADRILLAEGQTETRLLPLLYEHIHGRPPMADRVAILGIGSSQNIIPTREILSPMSIPTRVLCDMDFVMRSAEAQGLVPAGDADIAACKCLVATVPGATIDPDTGWPCKNQTMTAAQAFAAMAAMPPAQPAIIALHAKLRAKGFWFWPLGCIEDHLGIPGKKPHHHAAFREKVKIDWKTACKDPVGVQSFMQWLATP